MTTKAKKPAAKTAAKKPVAKPSKQAVATLPPTDAPTTVEIATAKSAAPKRTSKNGIIQPAEGTSCRAVWDAIDTLIAQGKKITLEAVRELAGDKMADATIRTQRHRHKAHHALTA